jgi:hypothetical protein
VQVELLFVGFDRQINGKIVVFNPQIWLSDETASHQPEKEKR